jgi:hypothetical protein
MAVTIDAGKLRRQIASKYGGAEDQSDHNRYYWWVDGRKCGGAKFSHGSKKKDLPDYVASDIARKLNVSRRELKEMEICTWGTRERLEDRLRALR